MKSAAAAPLFVTVHSEPPGANVWSDGRFAGVTPLPLAVSEGRSVRVQLSLPGYASRTVDFAPHEGSRVVTLDREPQAAVTPAVAEAAPTASAVEKRAPAASPQTRVRAKRRTARAPRKAHDAYEKF